MAPLCGKIGNMLGNINNIFGYSLNNLKAINPAINRQLIFNHYVKALYLIASNRYKWKNLPITIEQRILEQSCIFYGYCLFLEIPYYGYSCLPCTSASRLDINDIPIKRYVNRANGFHTIRTKEDSVLIFNDTTLQPMIQDIIYFAQKLTNIQMAKEVNTALQMRPKLIVTDEDGVNTWKNISYKSQLGEPVIYAKKGLISGEWKDIDLGVECRLEEYEMEKNAIYSEYLTFLGYNNLNIFKRANLISEEALGNADKVIGYRNNGLDMRKKACQEINAMFGLEIEVEFVVTPEGIQDLIGGNGDVNI